MEAIQVIFTLEGDADMAQSNLLVDIRIAYDQLTKLEKRVADFVLIHPQDVIKMTLSDLAAHCGVGDTTVFRFCRSMKLNGYQDFKLSLAVSLHANEVLDSRENISVEASRDLKELAGQMAAVLTDCVEETLASLDCEAVSRTVDAMLSASGVYLFGFGSSGIAALLLQNRIMRVLPNVFFSSDAHMQLTAASLLKPDSMAVIFCNSGITVDSLRIAELAHEAGATTVFITKFMQTPAAAHADILLPCGATEGPMQGGSVSVFASQLALIGLIYSELIRRLGAGATENKIKTAKVIAQKRL